MEESHREGVAIHPAPESCVVACEGAIEALTGALANESPPVRGRGLKQCDSRFSRAECPYMRGTRLSILVRSLGMRSRAHRGSSAARHGVGAR